MAGVKVAFGDDRLVLPLGNTSDRVGRLLNDISIRFRLILGKSERELKFVQLHSQDGYHYHLDDVIGTVITPGDALTVVDFASWADKQQKLFVKRWATLSRPDYDENSSGVKYLSVGLHKHNAIYFAFWEGNKLSHLELVPLGRLATFHSDGEHPILALKGRHDEWSVEAKFIVAKIESFFIVTDIVAAVKSTSDDRPEIIKIKLTSSGDAIDVDSTETVQKANERLKGTPPALAKDVLNGDSLPNEIKEIPGQEARKAKENNSGLQVEQVEPTYIEQGNRDSSGSFWNVFHSVLRVTNKSAAPLFISKVESKYEAKSGDWLVPEYTRLGSKYGNQNYNYEEPPYNVAVEPGQSHLVAVRASIRITSEQIEKRRRIHPSLPRPLNLSLTLIDNEGKKATLHLTCGNPKLEFDTSQVISENVKKPVEWFVACDDTNLEERLHAYLVLHTDEERPYLELCNQNRERKYLYESDLDKYAYEARQANKSELELEWGNSISFKAAVLYSPELRYIYAVHLTFNTTSSSAVYERYLPAL